jgi:hypothetical protein
MKTAWSPPSWKDNINRRAELNPASCACVLLKYWLALMELDVRGVDVESSGAVVLTIMRTV